MTHFSRENRVFCTIRVFFRTGFKKFSFSLASCDYSSSCPSFPLSKSSCSHTHSPFSSSLIHQFSSKGMGFVSFSMYFTFLTEDFLDWVFLMISVHMILEYGYLMLWWDCCVGCVDYMLSHSTFGCTMWYLWQSHVQRHDWDLNLMILGFSSIFLF